MKTLITLLAVLLLGISAALYLAYGTIEPCGILKRDLMAQAEGSQEQPGHFVDLLTDSFDKVMVDTKVDPLSPAECIQKLYKLHVEGEDPFGPNELSQ